MLKDWDALFSKVREKEYARTLKEFLDMEYDQETVYPPRDMVFQAFRFTSPKDLKAVIIGQDPYHNSGEAMGLAFSVPPGIDTPPSLVNIYKEIERDCSVKMDFGKGDLYSWAKQGVLLLNVYLTVREGQPLSHKREEYLLFAKDVISYIETLEQPIVYFLWGNFARKFAPMVHQKDRLVLESAHPSPLSANRGGWFGQHQFSRANDFFIAHGVPPIDWQNS